MTLLALLLALAQQGGQPTTHDQPGVSQPSPNDARPEKSTSSNTTDKAESLPSDHPTDLAGAKPAKKAKHKKSQARTAKPLPESYSPPSAQQKDDRVEREGGKGKAPRQPKPIGEKADQ
jgi:hypothetical protein